MPYMYSEMQNKLSKTRESPLESMEQLISSRCPNVFCLCCGNTPQSTILQADQFLLGNYSIAKDRGASLCGH